MVQGVQESTGWGTEATKERPIIFSSQMVKALLSGMKTQTRRSVKPQPECGNYHSNTPPIDATIWHWKGSGYTSESRMRDFIAADGPFYPGMRLWVRETHYCYGHWEPRTGPKSRTRKGRQRWMFVRDTPEVRFDPPESFRKGRHHKDPFTPAWHKRLARFMPHSFSRITLEITGVRVERLQDISEEDAIAEGCPGGSENGYFCPVAPYSKPSHWYADLWDKINGKGSWAANCWVWVISFRRIEQ